MNGHDSKLCDYNSPAFMAGVQAGKDGLPSALPAQYAMNPVHRASWLEGWLMGDTEREA